MFLVLTKYSYPVSVTAKTAGPPKADRVSICLRRQGAYLSTDIRGRLMCSQPGTQAGGIATALCLMSRKGSLNGDLVVKSMLTPMVLRLLWKLKAVGSK